MQTADNAGDKGLDVPKKGDLFHCHTCGMALEITVDCKCPNKERVHFHCCGREMRKQNIGAILAC